MNQIKNYCYLILTAIVYSVSTLNVFSQETIPLPEHPRPDFERSTWLNLNGNWALEFDKNDVEIPKNGIMVERNLRKLLVFLFHGVPLCLV